MLLSETNQFVPLQTKVTAALALLLAAFAVAAYLILRATLLPIFHDIEIDVARKDLKRAEMALRNDLENLEAITADWAPWDDIYAYVRGENPAFASSNLRRPTLENLGLDFMAVYGLHGRLVWGQVLVGGVEKGIGELQALDAGSAMADTLLLNERPEIRTAGFLQTAQGPALVSARPILRTDDSGPVAGALVMGQFLNASHLERLRDRTGVEIDWTFGDAASLEGGVIGLVATETMATAVRTHKVLPDVAGRPYLVLETTSPRQIFSLGERTASVALAFLCFAGVLATAFIWFVLNGTITRPIRELATHIGSIRESGDLTRKLGSNRNDEIGALARQFDDLTGDVYDARLALLDQSFKAGKADTAAEVLHNIRNAMTPLINGLHRLGKQFRVADRLRVQDAVRQLGEDDCPAERRGKLLEYVDVSFRHVAESGQEALNELGIVTAQARQIEGILSDQERFANVAPVAEDIAVDSVLSEATHVIPRDAQPAVDVSLPAVVSGYRVRAHRIGLLQVISNLVLNAYESIQRSQKQDGRIDIDATDELVEGRSMVRLTIRDNGSGFRETDREKIFQRGFTSKTAGETTGLGLHWCANAVAGMGGRIVALSAGPGEGAEFRVLLPAAGGEPA